MHQVDLPPEASFVSVWVATCVRGCSQPLGPAGASLAADTTNTHPPLLLTILHTPLRRSTYPPSTSTYVHNVFWNLSLQFRKSLFYFGIFPPLVVFLGEWLGICLPAILAEVDWSGYTCNPPRLSSLNLCLVGGAYCRRRAFKSCLGIYKSLLHKFGLCLLLPDASLDSD